MVDAPFIATASATTASQLPLLPVYVEALLTYVVSPAVVASMFLFAFSKSIKFGEIKKDFETIKNDVAELKEKSGSIITNVTVIKTHLVDKAGMNASLFQTMSPISLTTSGKKLIKEVGFDVFVTQNYEEISSAFMDGGVDTLFKLDELSESLVTQFFEMDRLPSYDNEAFKRGLSTEVLLRACALYLRDYMAKKLSITE